MTSETPLKFTHELAIGGVLLVMCAIAFYILQANMIFDSVSFLISCMALIACVALTGVSIWRKWAIALVTGIIGVLVFGGMTFCLYAVYSLIPPPIFNVKKYPALIARTTGDPLFAHFPNPIPPDAQNVRFYFTPGPLQADMIMQLRYTTTPEEFERLYQRFAAHKIEMYRANQTEECPDGAYYNYVDDAPQRRRDDNNPQNILQIIPSSSSTVQMISRAVSPSIENSM